MDTDRRHFPRYRKEFPVRAELPDGHRLIGTTCDLSRNGARLRIDHSLPSGIGVMIALEGGPGCELYTLWACVQHSQPLAQPECELGIEYAHPPEHYLDLIGRIAAQHETPPVRPATKSPAKKRGFLLENDQELLSIKAARRSAGT